MSTIETRGTINTKSAGAVESMHHRNGTADRGTDQQPIAEEFKAALKRYTNHHRSDPERRTEARLAFASALVRSLEGSREDQVRAVDGLLLAIEFKIMNGVR